jgi:hypothetical protein
MYSRTASTFDWLTENAAYPPCQWNGIANPRV